MGCRVWDVGFKQPHFQGNLSLWLIHNPTSARLNCKSGSGDWLRQTKTMFFVIVECAIENGLPPLTRPVRVEAPALSISPAGSFPMAER